MLFDKNGLYVTKNNNYSFDLDYNYDYDYDYDFAVNIMNGNTPLLPKKTEKKFKIYDLEEGFTKGNLFPHLYDPYKTMVPSKPQVSTERERLLLEIQKLEFAIIDLNLYLDLNPKDNYAYQIFKKYVMECKKKKEEYKNSFGPLVLDDLTSEYEWSKGNWPWEGRKYNV